MLTITLLGTAATMPLPERALTAAVAECGGHSLLLGPALLHILRCRRAIYGGFTGVAAVA